MGQIRAEALSDRFEFSPDEDIRRPRPILRSVYTPLDSEERPLPEYYYDLSSAQILIGRTALRTHVESGGNSSDVKKLRDLIEDESIDLSGVEVSPLDTTEFSRDDHLAYGRWLIGLLEAKSAKDLTARRIERAGKLGVFPTIGYIRSETSFKKVSTFQRELGLLGVIDRSAFDDMSITEVINHLRKVEEEEGKEPTLPILWRRHQEGRFEPSPTVIRKKISFPLAYELAGNIHTDNWGEEDYLTWQVKFRLANGGLFPKSSELIELSKKKLGPSPTGVLNNFESYEKFDRLGKAEYEKFSKTQLSRGSKINKVRKVTEKPRLAPLLFEGTSALSERIPIYAKYKAINELIPGLRIEAKARIARITNNQDFIVALNEVKRINPLVVEAAAMRAGVYFDIWPRDSLEGLTVQRGSEYNPSVKNIGGVRIRRSKRRGAYIIHRLEPEAPPGRIETGSIKAEQVISRVNKKVNKKRPQKFTIRGTQGVSYKQADTIQ